MMLPAASTNTILLAVLVTVTARITPGDRVGRRAIFRGALAAVGALSALAILAYLNDRTGGSLQIAIPGHLFRVGRHGSPALHSHTLRSLIALALVEEVAKYIVIAPWCPVIPTKNAFRIPAHHRDRAGSRQRTLQAGATGVGFASAEHLLFLILPIGLFLRRLVFATSLHAVTATLYARPRILRQRGAEGPAPLVDTALLALGVTVHLGYNLILRGLDGLTVF